MRKRKDFLLKIIKLLLQKIYKLFGKDFDKIQWRAWIQFISFSLVGISNFLVSYIVYALFISVFQCTYHLSNIAAYIISVLNAYFWNNQYVFRQGNEKRVWWKVLLKTYLSYAFSGLFLTEILLFIEINILGIPKLLAPFINLAITTPVNFVINKFWAFRNG